MVHAGHLFEAYGYSNQGYHIYAATGLQHGEVDLDLEEQDLVSRAFPLPEVERMIRDGDKRRHHRSRLWPIAPWCGLPTGPQSR
jgi:hypothetical protein